MSERKRRRKPGIKESYDEPIVQVMPEKRARIRPDAIRQIACYLLAWGDHWRAILRETGRGYSAHARERLTSRKRTARIQLDAIDQIVRGLMGTVSLTEYLRIMDEWDQGIRSSTQEGDQCQSQEAS